MPTSRSGPPLGTRREPALNRVTTRAVRSTSNLVLPYPQVVSSDPHGLAAVTRLHIGLLWSCGALTRPVHYRGLHRCAVILARAFRSHPATTVVTLREGGRLRISPSDPYWASLIAPGWSYEPELAAIVKRAMRCDNVAFLDLGANIGYWTVIADLAGAQYSVAVEASPAVRQLLLENVSLNGIAAVVHPPAAVWSTTGDLMEIRSEPLHHEGGSVVRYRDDDAGERYFSATVPTVTIDDLAVAAPPGPILIKMDLEGAEVEAMKGAQRTIADRDVVIVYEDHGQDLRPPLPRACCLSD